MSELYQEVQEYYRAAVEALLAKLEQDRYVLAVVLYGSLARGEAWERSDVDLVIIQQDGLKPEVRGCWLVQDGVNIWTEVVSRTRFKQWMERTLPGSPSDAIRTEGQLLFSRDASIAAWFRPGGRIGARDQEYRLLSEAAEVPYTLDKAEKWCCVTGDLDYSFVWILYTVMHLARIEVLLNEESPRREVIQRALHYNPAFFGAVYTDLIHAPKDERTVREALGAINAYLEGRAGRLYKTILEYLAAADGPRSIAELHAHVRNKVGAIDLLGACEWLARRGIVEKAAVPVRLTRKSQVTLEEPAYYYAGGTEGGAGSLAE